MTTREEAAMELPRIQYPAGKLELWRTSFPVNQRLQIINPQDFPFREIQSNLGIDCSPLLDSFALADPEEIKNRWKLMHFLVDHPDLVGWLLEQPGKSDLPIYEEEFLSYFDPQREHTPFWEIVHQLITSVDSYHDAPTKLKDLVQTLKKNLPLEEGEKQIGRILTGHIQKVANIEGVLTFLVGDLVDELKLIEKADASRVHGFHRYSSDYTLAEKTYPEWAKNSRKRFLYALGWPVRFWQDIREKRAKKKALRKMVVSELTIGIIEDIKSYLEPKLRGLASKVKGLEHSRLRIYFKYSDDGMFIKVVSWEPEINSSFVSEKFKFEEFNGYSRSERSSIKESRQQLGFEISQYLYNRTRAMFLAGIEKELPSIMYHEKTIDSPKTDLEHRWFALSNLYRLIFPANYKTLNSYRKFVFHHLRILREVAYLVRRFSEKAKELNSPLCWPELRPAEEHIVAFDEIFPIHLLHRLRKTEITPIRDFPSLNGNMIGLTGVHEGGKTVTSLTIPECLYLAQSGLPVFGRNFRFNIKKVLGLVFMSRGEGSTAKLLVEKTVNVIEASRRARPSETILVFDELGEGTQQDSGFGLGKDVLNHLAKEGVSVVFNTQITELAEFASENLKVHCLQLDAQHNLQPGIGTGDMAGLRNRSGLNELLR